MDQREGKTQPNIAENLKKSFQLHHFGRKSLNRRQVITVASTIFLHYLFFSICGVILTTGFLKLKIVELAKTIDKIIFVATLFFAVQILASIMMMIFVGYYFLMNMNQIIIDRIENGEFQGINKLLKFTSSVYLKLLDVFETISQIFVLFIILFLMVVTAFIVYFFYTLFVFLSSPGLLMFYFLLTIMALAIFYVPFAVFINAASDAVQTRSSATCTLLQQLINKSGTAKDLKTLSSFELLVAHRRPTVSCGMFDLNWKLVFSIIGSVFSYSIIVIQFSDI